MKKIVLSLSFLISSLLSLGCLNETSHTIDGRQLMDFFAIPKFYRAFDTTFSKKYVAYYDLTKRDSIPYEELSDVAVNMTKLGRFNEALELLLWVNERHPDVYQVHANLGTVYELTGNIDSAYYFIESSMKLNEESHHGSEWVHLLILKAKKQMLKDPQWIYKNNVLNLGLNYKVELNTSLHHSIDDTIAAINYQMLERIPFSPVPDLLIANIFVEMGDMLAMNFSVREAYAAYMIAGEYDPEDEFRTLLKRKKIEKMVEQEEMGIPHISEYFSEPYEFQVRYDTDLPGYEYGNGTEFHNQAGDYYWNENTSNPVTKKILFWVLIGGFSTLVIALVVRAGRKK